MIEMEREGWRARATGRDHTYKEKGRGGRDSVGRHRDKWRMGQR